MKPMRKQNGCIKALCVERGSKINMTRTAKNILAVMTDLGIAKDTAAIRIHRTYSGHWQRSAGALSWFVTDAATGMEICGSQYTCTEIVQEHKKHNVVLYTPYLVPELIVDHVVRDGQ